ncbi:DUF2891 domain-containing protein [Sinomicrobium weinanense]|uniref:DUF2891 domain-containing protein n=1 Tax=Sinomicrobium weinanense TaxID=2842200 RepID=A0A926Q269_9FLAO|nr:DUF2891 domain-containing protein [Sinomicrobium weinanense]MBC9796342.1 DUF2891 domain-containing protein [Sinomicrobium weinanense]MBU3122456.1 DUF2891 domain-containing protein [Sinomicrobium weinanense]
MKQLFTILILLLTCCTPDKQKNTSTETAEDTRILQLTLKEANRLVRLPLECMQTEYPNKLSQTLNDSTDIQAPQKLHPAFYGCFDWHSSVHGHWMLVSLLKQFPDMANAEEARQKLRGNISEENIRGEIAYFDKEPSYERTYGWAWLLKLAEELHTWNDPLARELEGNLQPLTDVIIRGYLDFLPKLNYPIRVGEHTNTAFGLTFAYDYAKTVNHTELLELIEKRARDFYLSDADCPMTWEPGGFDFLSPCLEEADIMRRILPKEEFRGWLQKFLPQLGKSSFRLEQGKVSDREDGKLVHLDGVNFSRAWCLYGIAKDFPEYGHLRKMANDHVLHSLPNIVDNNYEGTHWLGSFAVYALQTAH